MHMTSCVKVKKTVTCVNAYAIMVASTHKVVTIFSHININVMFFCFC